MYLLGAWPVLGFMGLDVWLLWWLFKRNYLDARRSETLMLTDRELIVDRIAPDGEREEHRLDAYWLKVELQGERLVRDLARQPRGDRPLPVARPNARKVAEQLKAPSPRCASPRYDARLGIGGPKLKPQHVLHAVEAGLLALQPQRARAPRPRHRSRG